MKTAKEQVRKLLDSLPDNDICYQVNDSNYTLHVRQQIELGMHDSLAGRVVTHTEMKRRYQLAE